MIMIMTIITIIIQCSLLNLYSHEPTKLALIMNLAIVNIFNLINVIKAVQRKAQFSQSLPLLAAITRALHTTVRC